MPRNVLPLALLIASLAPAGQAAEETVTIESDLGAIVGTLETPEGAPAPVVLMLHGFTGTRDELAVAGTDEGVFSRTARLLADAGYASLRIDFRGSGESAGTWPETTFSGQIADAVAAIDWLGMADTVDGSRVAVLGWSQGGLVAAHAAAARPEVRAAVLWAPAVHPMHTYADVLGADTVAEALAADPATPFTTKLPWGVETTLNAAFYQELPLYSTAAAVRGYDGPLKVIVGGRDTVVAPQPHSGQALMAYHEGPESLDVFETDHVFDAFTGPEVLDGQMVPATLDWLAAHL